MTSPDAELDTARARVVQRGLTPQAIAQLVDVVRAAPPEALTPIKQLLKRFFSEQPWTPTDDEALADAVGTGGSNGSHDLEPGLTLTWGWHSGRFRLRVQAEHAGPTAHADLGTTFDGAVQPQATPSPRTLRFATPPLHSGPSRVYDAAPADEARVARIFAAFDDVTNVLVGPDFVAVTISHADRWEALLAPMLALVAEQFTVEHNGSAATPEPSAASSARAGASPSATREPGNLERAWAELGALRADDPEDLARILDASRDAEPARRQVAAALLGGASPAVARDAWQRLLGDPRRMVRRAVVDAVVDTAREELRPLLERALDDIDAWTRWKALSGITALGAGSSRAAVQARLDDADFRVRLEAARALGAE